MFKKFLFLSLVLLCSLHIKAQQACASYVTLDSNYVSVSSGNTVLVPSFTNQRIEVCSFDVYTTQSNSSTIHVGLVYGTGTNCSVGTTLLTPQYPLSTAGIGGFSKLWGTSSALVIPAGNALCLDVDSSPQYIGVNVTYAILY